MQAMKKILLGVAAFASLLIAQPLFAQASRTFVSGVGDDVNPCSRTAPCKTFAGAITKTAAHGEINVLDPGGFGAVTITKSLTISGDGSMGGILTASTSGIVINAAANDVVHLRNLVLDGLGPIGGSLVGVNVLQAGLVSLENMQIFGFSTHGVQLAPLASATSGPLQVSLHNVKIRQTNGSGVQVDGTLRNLQVAASDLHVLGTPNPPHIVPAALAPYTTTGVNALGTASVDLHSSRINFATVSGVTATGANAVVRLSDTSINGNAVGLTTATSGQIISYNNNRLRGNTVDGAPTSTIYQR
jgi:hypothetical protein